MGLPGVTVKINKPSVGGSTRVPPLAPKLKTQPSSVPPTAPSSIKGNPTPTTKTNVNASSGNGSPTSPTSLRSKIAGPLSATAQNAAGIWGKLNFGTKAAIGVGVVGGGIALFSGKKDSNSSTTSTDGKSPSNPAAMDKAAKVLQDNGILKSLALDPTLSPDQKVKEDQRIQELASRQVGPNDVKSSLVVLGAQYRLLTGQTAENVTESRNLTMTELLSAAPKIDAELTRLQNKEKTGQLSDEEKTAKDALQSFKTTAQQAGLNLGVGSWDNGKASLPPKQKEIVAREVALEKIASGQIDPDTVTEPNLAGRSGEDLKWKENIDVAVASLKNETSTSS